MAGPLAVQGFGGDLGDLHPADLLVRPHLCGGAQHALLPGQAVVAAGPVLLGGSLLPVACGQEDELQGLAQGDVPLGGEGGVRGAVDHAGHGGNAEHAGDDRRHGQGNGQAPGGDLLAHKLDQGRRGHFLPTMRDGNIQRLVRATGYPYDAVRTTGSGAGAHASEEMIKAVVALRLIKEDCEIEELDAVGELGFQMHEIARNAIAPGVYEDEISAKMEYFAKLRGWGLSFETILSQHGETLHNCARHTPIAADRLVVVDAGVESFSHYASDHTRTYPATGKFTPRQRDIVQIVADCNALAFSLTRPGITYREVHLATVRLMLERLKDLGLVHGDIDEMQAAGVGGLFMPHGLGHNMGLDVHDMEEYGENYVGYDPDQQRAKQLGLGNLRMARVLRPGHVVTDEPGIYFIPALIEQFKRDGIGREFVDYAKLESYYDFGGVRIEDDVLVTPDGARLLGKRRLPASPDEVEAAMKR